MIGILGSAALLIGLGALSSAEGQPQAAIGFAMFVSGAALLMREISRKSAITEARDAQVEALEDARDAAIKHHLERERERDADRQHAADLRYWAVRHGANSREYVGQPVIPKKICPGHEKAVKPRVEKHHPAECGLTRALVLTESVTQ